MAMNLFFFCDCIIQGVGSAVNKLNDVVAMIAEVKSIAESLNSLTRIEKNVHDARNLRL